MPLFKNKNKPQDSPVRSPKELPAINGSPEYKLNKIHYNFKRNTIFVHFPNFIDCVVYGSKVGMHFEVVLYKYKYGGAIISKAAHNGGKF